MPTGRTITHTILAAVIAVASFSLYSHRLEFAPPDVQIDEVLISVNANQIAETGRDFRGNLLPLYTQTAATSWYQPWVIYLTAASVKVFPFSEWSIRLPAVLMSVLSVVLMFLVVARMAGTAAGVASAVMLALTPTLFIHSRYGMDYHYPIPFILGWLYCLLRFDAGRNSAWLVGGTAILGAGFYCYISSIVMMPLYLAMTMMWLYMRAEQPRAYGLAAAGMLPWLLPFLVWLVLHPEAYSATVVKYGLYDSEKLNAAQGLRSSFSFLSVGQRLSQYWNYYDPSLLFFGSGIKVQFSTNLVGVFLLPMAALILGGIYAALKRRAEPFYLIALLGFISAPFAAAIPTEENAIFRALGLLPFGVLLASFGLQQLWSLEAPRSLVLGLRGLSLFGATFAVAYGGWSIATGRGMPASAVPLLVVAIVAIVATQLPGRIWVTRMAVAGLLLLMPLQFASFWSDYFGPYRERVSFWLGGNIRGALEDVIARVEPGSATPVYFAPLKAAAGNLDWRNGFLDAYWQFYVLKHQRADLWDRARSVDDKDLTSLPQGAVVVSNVENTAVNELVKAGTLREVARVNEIDGRPFFIVLQK
ncbi:MAG TPA: glycosyltransferase family 39 protein [Vicinamibacterales bacterium]|nr:glycosyltransferase family 39 protein [Vicinamibacterales bacterium]